MDKIGTFAHDTLPAAYFGSAHMMGMRNSYSLPASIGAVEAGTGERNAAGRRQAGGPAAGGTGSEQAHPKNTSPAASPVSMFRTPV
jgi:hypothetical protein